MLNKTQYICSYLRPTIQILNPIRLMSSNGSKEAKMSITNDGQTIVCWHSDKQFPYEHSRPIPEPEEELKEDESLLKIQHRIDGQNIFKGKGPDLEELQMLTHTPQFKWKYRPLKRVLPKPPHPRKGV